MAWKKQNEVLLLTLLLVVTVSINFTFVLLVEGSKTIGVPVENAADALSRLSGYDQLEILSPKTLDISYDVNTKTSRTKPKPVEPEPINNPHDNTPAVTESQNQKVIYYKSSAGDVPITINYDKGTYTVYGREYPIIIDGDEKSIKIENPANKDASSYVELNYPRFDIFVNDSFYSANQAALDNLFNNFSERFDLLEQTTGWSSEEFYGQKLKIYVDQSGSTCWTGWAIPGEAHVILTNFFSNPAACKKEYLDNGILLLNNPGELGDYWYYMTGLLHESLHTINPLPIFQRSWLTEGFSEYYMFNLLSDYNGNGFTDINQETSDYYLFNGNFSSSTGNWNYYLSHDYKDKFNLEIQNSQGYDITAWMFSKMRDEHGLDWQTFFGILNSNSETLDYSRVVGLVASSGYYTDTYVIDVFGMASGLSFNDTKGIWQYDGSSGPGWGVRNWEDTGWYSDLTSVLSFSDSNPEGGETINLTASVYNQGDTNSNDVSVRFYEGTTLLDEQIVNVPSNGNVLVNSPFTSYTAGDYTIVVKVDEDNIKVESDETNNDDSEVLSYSPPHTRPSCYYDKYTGTYTCS